VVVENKKREFIFYFLFLNVFLFLWDFKKNILKILIFLASLKICSVHIFVFNFGQHFLEEFYF